MKADQLLLGFDAREMWIKYNTAWPQERRNLYLLRTDIDKPLSTDPIVWPSILNPDFSREIPSYVGHLDLAANLQHLRTYLISHGDKVKVPYWMIGISVLLSEMTLEERHAWNERAVPTIPQVPEESWSLLGYDVSDTYFLSGLSNCGYSDGNERGRLARQYAEHLNKYHLLTTLTSATELRVFNNARVVEHAPFFIYCLFKIDGV